MSPVCFDELSMTGVFVEPVEDGFTNKLFSLSFLSHF